jgi:hypothetical protein
MLPICSPFTWDRLWQRLVGPLPQDAVRPEDDRRRSLGVAVAAAWEEGWAHFEWRGRTYQVQPAVRLVRGREVL